MDVELKLSHGHNKVTKKQKSWNVKESKIRSDTVQQSARVDLNPFQFSELIESKGVAMKIFRSAYCPRVKSVDGAEHEVDCDMCNGSGFIDLDPICTKGFIQSQELETLAQVEGFVDGNTVAITFPIGIELHYFTRIELEDFTDIYPQRVMRKPGSAVDVLKYRACRVNFIMDYDGIQYYQDSDYKLDVNGNILWLGTVTQLIEFSAVPDSGNWQLIFNDEVVGTYDSSTTAATLQTDLRAETGFTSLTITGNFASGFLVTFVDVVNGVFPLKTTIDELESSSVPVTIEITESVIGGPKRPIMTKVYTIHYEAHVQYRAVRAMHVNRFTQYKSDGKVEHLKMPEQWMCTKEFLVKRRDLDGNELEQGPYSEHEITEED